MYNPVRCGMATVDFQAIEERRQQYIRAHRVNDLHALTTLALTASSEDLEWWVQTLEAELEEMPHQITDPVLLEKARHQSRTTLILARSRLSHRRTVERASILSETNVAKWSAILSVSISLGALVVAMIALVNSWK